MSTPAFTHDVFLSHSAKDKLVVRLLAERLRKDGLKVWFDDWVLKPGDSVAGKIEEGLEHSRVLVLCMSANAFGADWAQLEAGTFRFRDPLNNERRFIPLRLDDAPIKGSLAQFLYLNWRSADREQEYAKLLEACCKGERAIEIEKHKEVGWIRARPEEVVVDRDSRDDFPARIKDTLARRVGMRCSNPACRRPTSGPQSDPNKALNIGVAAHITAASAGGPRYALTLSRHERSSIENGIWLCQNCAKLVDSDEIRYTVELLRRWKIEAENEALRHIEAGHDSATGHPQLQVIRSPEEIAVRARYLNHLDRDIANRLTASIHHARLLEINVQERTGSTLPWGYRAYAPAAEKVSFDRFSDAFEYFHRRLLLLGTPGCGKTTTLLHLTTTLIANAREDETAPLPLFFNLSSFRPPVLAESSNALSSLFSMSWLGREESAFEDWLVNQITALRGAAVPAHLARSWVETGAVALLLDGLDEVAEHYTREVAILLNRTYFQRHPEMPVAVACRFVEYQPLEDSDDTRLWLEGGVVLQPLADDRILEYLEKTQAQGLKDALPGDQVLMEMARTPLTLSMMVLAYGGLAPTEMQQDKPPLERRRHLLDTYVSRMMQRHARRKVSIPYDANEKHDQPTLYGRSLIDRTLGWMAVRLSERSQTLFPLQDLHNFLTQQSKVVKPRFWITSTITACLMGILLSLLTAVTQSQYSETSFPFILLSTVAVGASVVGSLTVWLLAFHDADPHSEADSYRRSGFAKPWPERIAFALSIAAVLVYSIWGSGVILVSFSLQLFAGMWPVGLGFAVIGLVIVGVGCLEPGTSWRYKVGRLLLPVVAGLTGALVLFRFGLTREIMFASTGPWPWAPLHFGVTPDISNAVAYGSVIAVGVATSQEMKGEPFLLICISTIMAVLSFAGCLGVAVFVAGTLDAIDVVVVLSACLGGLLIATDKLARAVGFTLAIGAIIGGLLWGLDGSICVASGVLLPYALAKSEALAIFKAPQWLYALGRWLEATCCNFLDHALLFGRGDVPLRIRRLMRYCTEVILLKNAPGGHEFMHRLLRDHFAIRELVPRLSVSSGTARLRVIEQLSLQGESSLDALGDLAAHSDPHVRAAAATGLGRVPSSQVPSLLMGILQKDISNLVRSATVEASRPLAEDSARPLLDVAFCDADGVVRAAALRAVGRRHADHYWGLLRAGLSDSDPQVIREVLLVISSYRDFDDKFGNLIGLTVLASENPAELLGRLHPFLHDVAPTVRGTCAEILGQIGHVDSITALQKAAADSNKFVRYKAVGALGKCGDASVASYLITALHDPSVRVRGAAAAGLRALRSRAFKSGTPEKVVSALCHALQDRRNLNLLPLNYASGPAGELAAEALENLEAQPKLVCALIRASRRGNSKAASTLWSLRGLDDDVFVACLPHLIDPLINICGKSIFELDYDITDRMDDDLLEERQPSDDGDQEIGVVVAQLQREGVVPMLLRWLRTGSRWKRMRAARALSLLRIQDVVPDLHQILIRAEGGASKAIHWMLGRRPTSLPIIAAEGLGEIGEESSVALLESVAGDKSRTLRLRTVCIKSLGQFRSVVAVEALARILQNIDTPFNLANDCIRALGSTRSIAAVGVLENAMRGHPHRKLLEPRVVTAFGKIGGERAFVAVCSVLNDASHDLSVRKKCVATLARIGGLSAEGVLVGTLHDAVAAKEIRDACAWALGKWGSSAAIEALVISIRDNTTNEELRQSCISALTRSDKGVRSLCELVHHRPYDLKLRWITERMVSDIPNPDAAKQLLDAISLTRRSQSKGLA